MYLLFNYLQYMTSGYRGMRSPERFRAQIHKLKNADKLPQLSNKFALNVKEHMDYMNGRCTGVLWGTTRVIFFKSA